MNFRTVERTLSIIFACLVVSWGALFAVSRLTLAVGGGTSQTAAAESQADTERPAIAEAPKPLSTYIEVVDGCGPYYGGDGCVNIRSGPGTSYPVVGTLRSGVVLKTADSEQADGHTWYRITFDEWVRYPDRLAKTWYVAGDFVRVFTDPGIQEKTNETPTTSKRIIVDRSEQLLRAYDGDELFMEEKISTGLELTPTPRGSFVVFKKTPSRYMQGPLPGISDQEYDLPGVPWDLYFTEQGAAIHGAYWHDKFGEQWSHGCVNLPPQKAKELYDWAPLGTKVIVRD